MEVGRTEIAIVAFSRSAPIDVKLHPSPGRDRLDPRAEFSAGLIQVYDREAASLTAWHETSEARDRVPVSPGLRDCWGKGETTNRQNESRPRFHRPLGRLVVVSCVHVSFPSPFPFPHWHNERPILT